jgi:hypothetical protein
MNNKISDFKLAESIIKRISKAYSVQFSDVFINFGEGEQLSLDIGQTKNVAHTIYSIVSEYIGRSQEITGVQFFPDLEQRNNFLLTLATNLRQFIYNNKETHFMQDEELHPIRLYQYPLVWIIVKDIICPVFDRDLENIKVVHGKHSEIDICRFYEKGEIEKNGVTNEPFIFLNSIDNRVLQNAYLLIEAIRSLDLSPIETMKEIYESDIYDKFRGLLELALDDEEVSNFECTLVSCLGFDLYETLSTKLAKQDSDFVKIAQNLYPSVNSQWWPLGVLEKMLEPTRGMNWEVYDELEPYVKEFWEKVEEIKQKRIKNGHDEGVPFDILLRLKSKQTVGYDTDPTITLQGLLSSDRIW